MFTPHESTISVFTTSEPMKRILFLLCLMFYSLWGRGQNFQRDSVVFLKANAIELTSTFPEDDLYQISQVYLIGQGYHLETSNRSQKMLVGIIENEALTQTHKIRIQIKKDRLYLQWEHPLNQSIGFIAVAYLPSSPIWPKFEALANELKGYLTNSDKYYLTL